MKDEENNDPLGKSLGLPSSEKTIRNLLDDSLDDSALSDFRHARSNVRDVISTGCDSLNLLSQVAEQSQAPRAYEVLAKLIDTLVNANKALVDMQMRFQEIKQRTQPSDPTVTNNILVGTTNDILRILQNGTAGAKTIEDQERKQNNI